MKELIITARSMSAEQAAPMVGGKGANLLRLVEAQADVPPFIILTSRCFDEFVGSFGGEFQDMLSKIDCTSPSTIAATGQALRDCMCRHPLPPAIAEEMYARLAEAIPPDSFLAVRSSALGEDSKEFSYAGMLDTLLFQRSHTEISRSVVQCWASIYSDRAIAYRHMRNIAQSGISMAVVVQKMIDGVASGVTFTVNPTTRYEDEILISAVWGLGEGLVSGGVDADQFVCLRKDGYPIDFRRITEKPELIKFDAARGAGTIQEALGADQAAKPCLTDPQVCEIASVCHRIETRYRGVPQDIEWTIDRDDGKLKILQARPITTIDRPWPSERKYMTLWDNSNIVESYSGVTSPLTFSFAIHAYHMVYVQFCQVLGVPEADIQKNDFAFANMLGLMNGRIYYNLKNWYKLVSVLPGYSYNARFMEGMMGVKATFEEQVEKPPEDFFSKYFVALPKVIKVGFNLAWKFYNTDAEVKRFMEIYKNQYEKYKDFDFDSAPAHKIVEIYNELENTVLRNWKAPIINDFMAMIFYGVLRSLLKSWDLGDDPSLPNDLCSGQGNVESTLPMRSLQKMARFICQTPSLKETFRTRDPVALKGMFARRPAGNEPPEFTEMCNKVMDYLDEYGYRAMNELKLEEPSLSEKPEFLFSILKNYAAGSLPPEEDSGQAEAEKRKAAERKVAEKLGHQTCYGFFRKIDVLNFVTRYAKKAMAVREYQRFARTKMYGLVRKMYIGIGRRFVERGVLDRHEDVFYLTTEEVISFVVGTARSQKLREIAALRKGEFDGYRAQDELPDRIETHGIVYTNDLRKSAIQMKQSDDPNVLTGLGGCSGVVKGKVKVILNPSDDMSLNGEILVAARTDPGWVPLFPSAAGLIIERGSMLSHSVIVARELGLPAIVGVTGATKRLKTGDLVEMDGTSGIIRILSQ